MISRHIPSRSAWPRRRGISAGLSKKPEFQGTLNFHLIQTVSQSGRARKVPRSLGLEPGEDNTRKSHQARFTYAGSGGDGVRT